MIKKLLLLLFSFLISLNIYAESYICAFECYDTDKKTNTICQLTYERTNTGFSNKYSDFLAQEDENYLFLTEKFTTTGNHPVVRTKLINKLNGDTVSVVISTRYTEGYGYSIGGDTIENCLRMP
jgi:hypothetical protein